MLLSSIEFDNDLTISPQEDEEFRYELGEQFVYHWTRECLYAAYNTRFIRELIFSDDRKILRISTDIQSLDTQEIIEDKNDSSVVDSCPIEQILDEENSLFNRLLSAPISQYTDIPNGEEEDNSIIPTETDEVKGFISDLPLPRLIDICTCDPEPNPHCPVCNHQRD